MISENLGQSKMPIEHNTRRSAASIADMESTQQFTDNSSYRGASRSMSIEAASNSSLLKQSNKEYLYMPIRRKGQHMPRTLIRERSKTHIDLTSNGNEASRESSSENSFAEMEQRVMRTGEVYCDNERNGKLEKTTSSTSSSPEMADGESNLLRVSIGSILEFDRSDLSSDSEPERKFIKQRKISKTRKARFSLDERIRKISDDESKSKDSYSSRRRRSGVSGEPCRTWRTSSLHAPPADLDNQSNSSANADNDESLSSEGPTTFPEITINSSDMEKGSDKESEGPRAACTKEENTQAMNSCAIEETYMPQAPEEIQVSSLDPDVYPKEKKISTASSQLSEHHSSQRSSPIPSDEEGSRVKFNKPTQSFVELEKKYKTLLISFQTDQYTLSRRLEKQERARDVAESNMEKELQKLSSAIMEMGRSHDMRPYNQEIWTSLTAQVDMLRKAAMKVSAQAEQHGCYQQEKATAANLETMIAYVELLRKKVNELEEEVKRIKKLEMDQQISIPEDSVMNHPPADPLGNGITTSNINHDTDSGILHGIGTETPFGEQKARRPTPHKRFASIVTMASQQLHRNTEDVDKETKHVKFNDALRKENIYQINDPIKMSSPSSSFGSFYLFLLSVTSIVMFLVGSYMESYNGKMNHQKTSENG